MTKKESCVQNSGKFAADRR